MEQELPLHSSYNKRINRESNHIMMSSLWVRLLLIATAVKSILGLIILFLMLVVSTIVLFIGSYFRHSHHCPIEHNISLFLVVSGAVSIEWIILSIILSIITIVFKHIRSFLLIVFIILTALIILITNIFLFIWIIFGSIWTLKALNTVQYTNPYDDTFCRPTLYRVSLGYLIMTYIFSALQCWYRLCIVIFCSIQEQ